MMETAVFLWLGGTLTGSRTTSGPTRRSRGDVDMLSRLSRGETDTLSLRPMCDELSLWSLGDDECSRVIGGMGIDGICGRMKDGLRVRASACETMGASSGGGVAKDRVEAVEPLLSDPAHTGAGV